MQCAAALQQQIGFGPACGAPEMGQRMGVCQSLAAQQVFQHKGFPAGPADGVAAQGIQRIDVEQMVQQPGIAQVQFGDVFQPTRGA